MIEILQVVGIHQSTRKEDILKYEEMISKLFIKFPELSKGDHDVNDMKLPYYVFGSGVLVLEVQKLLDEKKLENDKALQDYFIFIEEMIENGDERKITLATLGFFEGLTNTKGYKS